MKVIFLDIDGVLNVMRQEFDDYGQLFHQNLVDNLSYIINETGAKIVISSTWRHRGLDFIKNMWKHRNLPGEVIDITPDCWDLIKEEKFGLKYYDDVDRGYEIQDWLNNHDVENYVILDDDSDMLESQINNFVYTYGNKDHPDSYDIGYGLTRKCAEMAIKILYIYKKNIKL